MPDPFITPQDLSDLLGRDVTADNGAIMACDAACDVCRTIAEQDFNAATTTEILDGSGTDTLLLSQRPVNAAGTVLVGGVAKTDALVTSRGALFAGSVNATWPLGRQNISVTYDHGYAVGDVPRDVRLVALMLAMRVVVQGVASQETVGDVTLMYGTPSADDLTLNELRILQKYRATRSF